jgi:hypothetical protein
MAEGDLFEVLSNFYNHKTAVSSIEQHVLGTNAGKNCLKLPQMSN